MTLQTEYLRIGRSGPTVDGRIIKEEWIDQAAATYDPKNQYSAKIWPDHNRYVNYGKVLAVRAEKNDQGGKDLYAVLEPNAFYQSDVRFGQKVNFSMEITPDFAKSGKAYLTGLGATDDPASLATSEVKFSKYAEQAGVFRADFVASEAKTFEDPAPAGLLDQIKALLFKNQPNEESDMVGNAALLQVQKDMTEMKALFANLLPPTDDNKPDEKPDDDLATQFAALRQSQEELMQKFNTLPKHSAEEKTSADVVLKDLQEKFSTIEQRLNDALKEQPGTDSGEHFGANNPDAQDIV
jgi:hypothetical protein